MEKTTYLKKSERCPGCDQWAEYGEACPKCGAYVATEVAERQRAGALVRTMGEGWMGVAQAARECKVNYETLMGAIRKGNLPAVHVMSGCWIVHRDAVLGRVGLHERAGRPRRAVRA